MTTQIVIIAPPKFGKTRALELWKKNTRLPQDQIQIYEGHKFFDWNYTVLGRGGLWMPAAAELQEAFKRIGVFHSIAFITQISPFSERALSQLERKQ